MKFPIAVGSTAIGIALLAGASQKVRADTSGQSDDTQCYYNMYHCSYPGDAYWSNCDPQFVQGYIPTSSAKIICDTYHDS